MNNRRELIVCTSIAGLIFLVFTLAAWASKPSCCHRLNVSVKAMESAIQDIDEGNIQSAKLTLEETLEVVR